MNKSIEDYEVEYWDGDYAGPIYDEQESMVRPKRRLPERRPPKTRLQQLDLELEYDIDEI